MYIPKGVFLSSPKASLSRRTNVTVRAARQASLRRQDGSGSCQSTFRYVRLGCARFDRASVCGLFAWLLVRTLRTAQLVADRRTTCPQLVGRQSLCRYRPAVTAPSAAPKSAGQPINAPSVDGRCAATPWPDSSDEGTSVCADAHGAERGDVAAARSAILPCLVRRAPRKSAGQPAERCDLARLRGSQDLADRLGMPASRTLPPRALTSRVEAISRRLSPSLRRIRMRSRVSRSVSSGTSSLPSARQPRGIPTTHVSACLRLALLPAAQTQADHRSLVLRDCADDLTDHGA